MTKTKNKHKYSTTALLILGSILIIGAIAESLTPNSIQCPNGLTLNNISIDDDGDLTGACVPDGINTINIGIYACENTILINGEYKNATILTKNKSIATAFGCTT